ncbi:hypothetical protein ABT025_18690 [Streptomyces sp. NPDC002809]|uniref:hypothetical protein n=1 Tax=Streptomyces sp. NPDC002809 TaxID=3154433 RepID=UPI003320C6D5
MTQQPSTVVPLWETEHPYYAAEGNFYKGGLHNLFSSWAEFTETTFYSGDRDMNLLYRWDWEKDAPETLKLFFILQRKAIACSAEMPITEADEDAVRSWLISCAATLRDTWAPLLP